MTEIRQPIVCVLGHVDHGKTTLLDRIRGTSVAKKEPGLITQHIGATEIDLDTILDISSSIPQGMRLDIPGLLFIDTPGHRAFSSLRRRGGSIADLAVLVVDIREGFKPQTIESLEILKRSKTPFIVAANKIDRIPGYRGQDAPFVRSLEDQSERAIKALDDALYSLISQLSDSGFNGERYDRITDFTKMVAIVPTSAKTGEGIADLIMVLAGLAQRYLEKRLVVEERGEGVVMEKREEEGLGDTLDVILYNGTLKKGDEILVLGRGGLKRSRVRGIFKARARGAPVSVDMVRAAAGVKVAAPDVGDVIAGSPLRVLVEGEEEIEKSFSREVELDVKIDTEGVILKADSLGSLEALASELEWVRIARAEVGDITKEDILFASTMKDPAERAIFGFWVELLSEAEDFLAKKFRGKVKIFRGNVIYSLTEDYEKWAEETRKKIEEEKRERLTYPASIKLLPGFVFRAKDPAIVGVRILSGRLKQGVRLLREDGMVVGKVRSIEDRGDKIEEAHQGMEVAASIDGPTVGRQIKIGQILYVDLSDREVRALLEEELAPDEMETLEKVKEIKRKKL
jgi:translation initiation factor 5B